MCVWGRGVRTAAKTSPAVPRSDFNCTVKSDLAL